MTKTIKHDNPKDSITNDLSDSTFGPSRSTSEDTNSYVNQKKPASLTNDDIEQITLHKQIIDTKTAGSKEWYKSSFKLGKIYADLCIKLLLIEEKSDIDDGKKAMTNATKIFIYFNESHNYYHECIQKSLMQLNDIVSCEKSKNIPSEKTDPLKIKEIDKMMHPISKMLSLDQRFYSGILEFVSHSTKLKLAKDLEKSLECIKSWRQKALEMLPTTSPLSDVFVQHDQKVKSQLDSINQLLTLLGQDDVLADI